MSLATSIAIANKAQKMVKSGVRQRCADRCGVFALPNGHNIEKLNTALKRSILIAPIPPKIKTEEEVAEEERLKMERGKAKSVKRKLFECAKKCGYTSKNKYQKVKSSGLPIWNHHPQIDCQVISSVESEETKAIQERIVKWERIKEEKANEKKACPLVQ